MFLSSCSHSFLSLCNLYRISLQIYLIDNVFVNVIFDKQYTEIKFFMNIVHGLNAKQHGIHIWIFGKVCTIVFYSIPHLEEQIPQMSKIRIVEKEAVSPIASQYQHWDEYIIVTCITYARIQWHWSQFSNNNCIWKSDMLNINHFLLRRNI